MYPISRHGRRLHLRELRHDDTDGVFAIYGDARATEHLSFEPRAATFGFALRPDTWGNGYGTETVRLLLAVAFDDLTLHRVWGARSPRNVASARTLERAGLSEEGYIREHVQRGGRWRDSVTHSILDHEYAASLLPDAETH
ncbi:GNAT family N-acetyltransferase [Streptomyces griseolus]|uniref:GNAT family N-acetyltransferase n=1 Tax=Streptomyces griseolus TaxID=1909 RepID=UPI0004C51CC3|nr:GNAT family protein [Streptomyces griseolus]